MGARPLCLSACLSLSLCHSPGGAPACEVRDSIASEYFRRYSESFCECVRDSAAASSPHPPTFSSGGSPGEHIRPLRDGRTLDRKRERGRGTHRWILWRSRASVANASRRGGCCIAPWCALSEADQPMAGSWALSLLWVRLGSRSIGVASGWAATCVSRTRTPTAFCQLRGQVRQRSRGPRTKEVSGCRRHRHKYGWLGPLLGPSTGTRAAIPVLIFDCRTWPASMYNVRSGRQHASSRANYRHNDGAGGRRR